MSRLLRDYKILKMPAQQLTTRCALVHFPLSQETLEDIYYLKACLRKNFGEVRTLGLSAPQVGILKRFFVMPSNWELIQNNHRMVPTSMLRKFDVFINPMVLEVSEQTEVQEELCLSVPEVGIMKVERPSAINVRYNTPDGKETVKGMSGVHARVFMHETQHLEGLTIQRFARRELLK